LQNVLRLRVTPFPSLVDYGTVYPGRLLTVGSAQKEYCPAATGPWRNSTVLPFSWICTRIY